MNEEEYLEEIKGRDGIISKLIDERDDLKKQLEELINNPNPYFTETIDMLKKQLADIKYLSEDNIWDAIQTTEKDVSEEGYHTYIPDDLYHEFVNKLMKLAYPKDRIIEVLKKYTHMGDTLSNTIANEIIGGE